MVAWKGEGERKHEQSWCRKTGAQGGRKDIQPACWETDVVILTRKERLGRRTRGRRTA